MLNFRAGCAFGKSKNLIKVSQMLRSRLFMSKDQEDIPVQLHMKFLSPKEGKK